MDSESSSNQFIFDALMQAPCLIYWEDFDNIVLGCNKHVVEFLGCSSPKAVVGKQRSELFPQEKLFLSKAVVNNGSACLQEYICSPNGKTVCLRTLKAPLKNESGKIIGCINISVDITEDKNQINFLGFLIEKFPGHVWWTDKNSHMLGCNLKMANTLGFSNVDEILGSSHYDLLDKSLDEQIKKCMAAEFDAIDQKVIQEGVIFDGEEKILIDGKYQIYHSTKAPLCDLSGNITGLIGVAQDITDNKNERETLRHILSILPGHVWWKDLSGKIQGSNDLMAKRLGFNPIEDIVGKTTFDLMSDKLTIEQKNKATAETDIIDNKVMIEGVSFEGEEPGEVDGEMRTFYSQKTPLKDLDGNITGLVGVAQDITELKETQRKLEKANEVKSEFIANMSHDLRTPITGMLGETEFIENNVDDSKVQESARYLKEATQQLLRLSNDILEYVSLESEHFDEPISVFNPAEIVEQVFTLMRVSSRHKSLKLEMDIDSRVPTAVKGYGQYFERIVSNLVANAIKFTHHGSVKVFLNLAAQTSDEVTLCLTVKDSGVGIPADKYEDIFDQFYKLSSSYQGLYKGSGLGLYSVKQYVGQMQGQITVDSVVGKGATFKVTLPFDKAVAAKTVQIDFSRSAPLEPLAGISNTESAEITLLNTSVNKTIKVLVVEDSPLPARAVMRLLNDHQCEVKLVNTGEEAVKEALKKRYDLILMDIGLPGIDGIEATRQIRVLPENNDVPIMALTGHARGQKNPECIAAGMQEVYTKPLSRHQLKTIFQSYLKPKAEKEEPNFQGSVDKFILDMPATMEKYGITDPKQLLDMLEATIEFIPDELAQLKAAAAKNNLSTVGMVIQDLKGGLSYIVAPECNDLTVTWDGILNQEVLTAQAVDVMITQLEASLNVLLDAIKKTVTSFK